MESTTIFGVDWDAATVMSVVAAFVASLAILFQTWLSFQFTREPPTAGYQIFLVRALLLLSGATAIGATTVNAGHDIARDRQFERLGTHVEEVKSAVQTVREITDEFRTQVKFDSIAMIDKACLSQRDLMRLLIVIQLRSDYQRAKPDNRKVWPPQRYIDDRLEEAGVKDWRVAVSDDQSSINIKDIEPEKAR